MSVDEDEGRDGGLLSSLRSQFALRLLATLLGAAVVLVAFGVVLYVQLSAGLSQEGTSALQTMTGTMVVVAIFSLTVVGVAVGGNAAITLRSLAEKAEQMQGGDLDVEFEVDRADEIGQLARTLSHMRDSLQETITDLDEQRQLAEQRRQDVEATNQELQAKVEKYDDVLGQIADGNFTVRVDPSCDDEAMESVGRCINRTAEQLDETFEDVITFAEQVAGESGQLQEDADDIRAASESISESIQEIAEGAVRQSEMLDDVAEEVENLSATAEEVASSTDQLASQSERAAAAGQEGGRAAERAATQAQDVVDEIEGTAHQIEELQGEMEAIGEITEFITDIAEQTNILALNASIEAARAGEAGEGFAVVADEVKGLAEETRDAAEDIEDRIGRVQEETDEAVDSIQDTQDQVAEGVETIEDAIGALEEIADYVDEMDNGVQNISSATADQARSVQTVVSMVEDLTAISEGTTQEAETVAASAEEQSATLSAVTDRAASLTERSDRLWDALRTIETGDPVEDAGEVAPEPTADGGHPQE
jgi:methyl-accepting chemotaxis protein